MTLIETIAKYESRFRSTMLKMPAGATINFFSHARKIFLSQLVKDDKFSAKPISDNLKIKIWDIQFRSPIFNAAGMFKTGQGYEMTYRQGAGAYLAGTTTSRPRQGNIKGTMVHPFMSYHSSGAASNWMGLPNEGHETVAARLAKIEKHKGFPIGASIAADSGLADNISLNGIIDGLQIYGQANVDFIELNESCPNVAGHKSSSTNFLDSELITRLVFVSDKFLKKRQRNLPVIVKFSNDTSPDIIPALVDLLIQLGYDGVNFGNTSIKYEQHRQGIHYKDLANYDYFTKNIGGGLSGKPLKHSSLQLSAVAAEYINQKRPTKEFEVIRTGGVFSSKDILDSRSKQVKLNQWFTGYFDSFGKHGHNLYSEIYKKLM